jgi:GT2 family glycosyltransferase/glycosyltransferase involved in cell wall biosynthesis
VALESLMTTPDANKLFDEQYYATGLGVPYRRDARWLRFFARIADRIVAEIGPASALDAGCALGLLVEQLRERGVDAEGVDISEYAIGAAHESVREHVRVGSVAEPFGRRYDLIVSIEVLEHMPREEAERAVANFCAHSDDVLFSSSPLDHKEATHFNVNPPGYWAELFARHGFFRDVDFDGTFVTPWAVRFRRRADPAHRVVRDYERRHWELLQANGDLRQLALEQRDQLAAAEARAAAAALAAEAAAHSAEAAIRRAHSQGRQLGRILTTEHEARLAREAGLAELRAYADRLEAELAAKEAHIGQLQQTIHGLQSGRVMRLLGALTGRRPAASHRPSADAPNGYRDSSLAEDAAPPSPAVAGSPTAADDAYARWIAANEPDAAELQRQRGQAAAIPGQPLISVAMAVFDPPLDALRAALESVRAQTYGRWELLIADGGSSLEVRAALEAFAAAEPRARLRLLGENRGIAGNLNAAIEGAAGELVLILDHDDALASNALFEIATLLAAHPDADVVYFDEDKVSEDGATRHSPWFKPRAPSPDLLLSTNYLMHGAFRRTLIAELGGFDPATDGAQDWDLALRASERTDKLHQIPRVLYHWRQVPGSAAHEADAKPWAIAAQRRALEGHLRRTGNAGAAAIVSEQGLARVQWPTFGLKVSIIIPTKDKAAILRACVESILGRTTYPNYEIVLVDTGSVEPATAAFYDELAPFPQVRVVRLDGPFNWGRANNFGARHATGERLLFLNNDTEAIEPGWLDELVGWAERPEVGVVGARLVRPDGTTQHAGIAIGVEGHGSHLFDGTSGAVYGPFGSSEWYRDLLAVTGACMLLRRELFDELGGFDEGYRVGYSDITFCLAAAHRGYRVVYTPFARLLHHEGASRGFDLPPADVLRATMELLPLLATGDPYYSPNLSPVSRVPAIAEPGGEDTMDRLATILRQFGLYPDKVSLPLRELAARTGVTRPPSPAQREGGTGGEGRRLLLVTHELGLSGAPIILANLAIGLAARGYRVTVAAPEPGPLAGRLEAAGVAVAIEQRLLHDGTAAYWAVAGFDLALVNTIHGAVAVHAARAAGVPAIWWIHESGFGRRLADARPEVASAFASAAALIFPAAATAERYAGLAPAPPAIIPYGVEPPSEGRRDPRMPRDSRLRAVLLGSVEPRKGQDTLLRAMGLLPEELRGELVVELIGGVIDWPYYESLRPLAASTPGARLLGLLPHADALARLAEADLLILPSRDEVLPVAILEAMAAGKAIVASAVGGIPAALAHGREALIFPAGDHRALAAHLERLIREPGLVASLGAAACTRYERDFTLEQFVDRMDGVIRGALASHPPAHGEGAGR